MSVSVAVGRSGGSVGRHQLGSSYQLKDKISRAQKCNVSFRGSHHRHAVETQAVLDKPAGRASGQHGSEPSDPARIALERLFLQAQRYEDKNVDSLFVSEGNLESAVTELEVDLRTALDALKKKEEELRGAERNVKADQWELKVAKSALQKRERELHALLSSQLEKKEELIKTKKTLAAQGDELQRTKWLLKQKEEEIQNAERTLKEKQEELSNSHGLLLGKDEVIAQASLELKAKDHSFQMANDLVAKQTLQIKGLHASLQAKEDNFMKLQHQKELKQEKLEQVEADLKSRSMSLVAAKEELKLLERDLSYLKGKDKELAQAKELLADVQKELKASKAAVAEFRSEVGKKTVLLDKQAEDLVEMKTRLHAYQRNLESSRHEVDSKGIELKLAQASYDKLKLKLDEARNFTQSLQEELLREKSSLQELVQTINSLKREIQEKDSALSDTVLLLQVKEAQLVAAKLELQELKSELVSEKLTLHDRALEFQRGQHAVQELRREVFQVKATLNSKEQQLLNMTTLLVQKDKQLSSMRLDLDDNKVKLSEATSVVERISALSKALVDGANQGNMTAFSNDTVLMQSNYDLFSANRALLERGLQLQNHQEQSKENVMRRKDVEAELEAMKECLREKEDRIFNMQEVLSSKEEEINLLLSRWDVREQELVKFREELKEEAKGLLSLHALFQQKHKGGVKTLGEHGIETLELEVAKLEVETTLVALESLAQLSMELVNISSENSGQGSFADTASDKRGGNSGAHSTFQANEESLDVQLSEKDTALEVAKKAMDNLRNLTEKLVLDAVTALDSLSLRNETGIMC